MAIGLVERSTIPGAVLHTSNEPGELSQWLCSIVMSITVATITKLGGLLLGHPVDLQIVLMFEALGRGYM